MIRMGWSWPEYCALPEGYLEPLGRLLKEHETRQRADAARASRRRR